jgi:hypothetical protein
MKVEPWKSSLHARICKECGSQRSGMQLLSLWIGGKRVRGYWHLKCFEVARKRSDQSTMLGG